MITRQQYLDGQVSHSEYYGQFVTKQILDLVKNCVGVERIKKSTVNAFNDIPLHIWDNLAINNKLSLLIDENNDEKYSFSLCGGVCILKEAARQIKHN